MISTVIQRRTIFASMVSATLLTACAPTPEHTTTPTKAVVGTVDLIDRIALPPQSVLVVELQDTSRADAAARMVSQQSIKIENLQPPFKFRLPVQSSSINPAVQYTVSARITNGNQPIFTNDIIYPVLTLGAGRTANIMLVRTAR